MDKQVLCGVALTIIGLAIMGLVFCSGCNGLFQPKPDTFTIPPNPGQQLWHTVKKSNWLVTLAIPIIALGAVAMFNGAGKLGMSAIIFGTVNLFMALATARFALWMGIFGLIGSGLAVAASILSKNKALREIICGVQKFKDNDKIHKLAISPKLKTQSPTTQKLVHNIKSRLKLKGVL